MVALRWQFPPYQAGYLAQDPIQRGFFTVDSIGGLEQALVREAIQNALDARSGNDPVIVRFAWVTVSPEKLRDYFQGLQPHLEAVIDGTVEVPDLTQPMSFLLIEDFNTTGLEGDPKLEYIEEPQAGQNFYYFWRNVGRTGKRESNRGRWGLGKTVFPAVSSISTFFGLTHRASDHRYLLMGQSVLKHHTINKTPYTPYGYFGRFDNWLALPVDDNHEIKRFCDTFQLRRPNHPGLSLVVAAPNPVMSPSKIGLAAIYQYFYPILTGDLRLRINHVDITDDNFSQIVPKLPMDGQEFDKETFLRLLNFARWAMELQDNDFIQLDVPNIKRAPDWKSYMSPEQIDQAREQFAVSSRVAFRIGMKVEVEKQKSVDIGWFKVFIERDSMLTKAESHYIRNGIRLVDIKGHSLGGIRGLVVIDDTVLGRMLGDAENPAHTEWQKDTPSFKRYKHGPSSLTFVKNSLAFLAGKLTEAGKVVERNLLSDIFFVDELPSTQVASLGNSVDRQKPDTGRTNFVFPDLTPKPQPIASRRIPYGVEIYSVPETTIPVSEISVQLAYEVRTGNPFSKYVSLDFDLGEDSMQIVADGAVVEHREGNELRCKVIEIPFRLCITGFDGIRDVVAKMNWEKVEA